MTAELPTSTEAAREGGAPAVDAIRQTVEAVLAGQEEHPMIPRLEALWNEDYDLSGVWMRYAGAVERLSLSAIADRVAARRSMISKSRNNKLWFQCEAEIWRQTDLRMARKRLEHPGMVLGLLVTGGVRGSKTEGSTRRGMAHFLYTEKANVWCLDEKEDSSKRQRQPKVYEMLPAELQSDSGKHKKDKRTQFTFSEGTGFTGNMFNVHWQCRDETGREFEGGGMWQHRFYGEQESGMQGAELTFAAPDELVPMSVTETVAERLVSRAQETREPKFLGRIREAIRLLEAGELLPPALLGAIYFGVQIISFTPKEGYSSTVAEFMEGAETLADTDTRMIPAGAQGLPQDFIDYWRARGNPEWLPGVRVPRFKQPKKSTRLIVYIHNYDNPFKGNWAGLVKELEGKSPEQIRISAYGDVGKNWHTQFSAAFRDDVHILKSRVHLRDLATVREFVDPARARPWFMGWQFTDPTGVRSIMREWPQEGLTIPGLGDPGAWAIVSRSGKKNGDAGPAQELRLGWSLDHYTREIWRVRMEMGEWFWSPEEARKHRVKMEWKDRPGWTLEGSPVTILESYMDSRFGNARMPLTGGGEEQTLIEAMAEREHGIAFLPAPGDRLDEGDNFIIHALTDYDEKQAISPTNRPSLQIWHECQGHLFSIRNFSLEPFRDDTRKMDEACKDPRDTLAMSELVDPTYLEPQARGFTGGGSF